MYRAKTVFVLGAGASFEVGLPLGPDLLATIVKMTTLEGQFGRVSKGDQILFDALSNHAGAAQPIADYVTAGRGLAALALHHPSIDYIIDALEDPILEMVGKLGIARAILNYEEKSSKFIGKNGPDSLRMEEFSTTWYDLFVKALVEDVRKSSIEEIFKQVSFINFNYDRSLEYYLPFAIAGSYQISIADARKITRSVQVYRPYGRVGKLPWQSGDGPDVPFGYSKSTVLSDIAAQLKTFTERNDESDYVAKMRRELALAERIVFLGFAFHPQNVELLRTPTGGSCEILGTVAGLSKDEITVVESSLSKAFQRGPSHGSAPIELTPLKCVDFFREYGRRLKTEVPPW